MCNKTFAKKNHLKNHQRTHKDEIESEGFSGTQPSLLVQLKEEPYTFHTEIEVKREIEEVSDHSEHGEFFNSSCNINISRARLSWFLLISGYVLVLTSQYDTDLGLEDASTSSIANSMVRIHLKYVYRMYYKKCLIWSNHDNIKIQ